MTVTQTGNIVTTGLALLAFIIAFYVLLARERKIPYITNFVFPPAALLIASVFFSIIGPLLQPPNAIQQSQSQVPVTLLYRLRVSCATISSSLAIFCLVIGIVLTLRHIWRLHNRQVYFRDDHWVRNTRLARWLKRKWRKFSSKQRYEHSPIDVNAKEVTSALISAGFLDVPKDLPDLRTISICKETLRASDPIIAVLCRELVALGWYVQYTSCVRHPFEFVQVLKSTFGSKWTENAGKVVVVDAYTPHFGFTDSIHEVMTEQLIEGGVKVIPAKDSYAGVHTANAKAFNVLKHQSGPTPPRKPALLLYEGANALSDLESTEQYRIFARHVLTSERMWGGMLTCFVEPTIGQGEADLLRAYSDLALTISAVKNG